MEKIEHYLDNSATTRPSEEALRAIDEALKIWGNPSSVHSRGQEAAGMLRDCRTAVGKTLGMQRFSQDRLVFTSSGTEANNIALLGCAHSKKRDPVAPGAVIISAGEHSSVNLAAEQLEREGYTLIRVPTVGGVLDLGYLSAALSGLEERRIPAVIASFMLVNNETGAIYDVASAAKLVKKHFPDAVVHCDAVQAYMKMKFTPASLGADMLTVSAHKIHSIRGAGALFISAETIKRKNVSPVMFGGGQEGGLRSGTENLVSIASFAGAAAHTFENIGQNKAKVEMLRMYLEEQIAEKCPEITLNKPSGEYLANICSIVVPGVRSETMLNFLSGRGIYVSAGSACAANSKKKSAALDAFGVFPDAADSTLRVSMDYTNTVEDIDALVSGLRDGLDSLQKKR